MEHIIDIKSALTGLQGNYARSYLYVFVKCSAIAERPRFRVRYSFRQK